MSNLTEIAKENGDWISSGEKIPLHGRNVLCCSDEELEPFIAAIDTTQGEYPGAWFRLVEANKGWELCDVDYWQPLPKTLRQLDDEISPIASGLDRTTGGWIGQP